MARFGWYYEYKDGMLKECHKGPHDFVDVVNVLAFTHEDNGFMVVDIDFSDLSTYSILKDFYIEFLTRGEIVEQNSEQVLYNEVLTMVLDYYEEAEEFIETLVYEYNNK